MDALKFVVANWQILLDGVLGVLSASYALSCAVPGEHPDKEIDAAANFLKRFSRK